MAWCTVSWSKLQLNWPCLDNLCAFQGINFEIFSISLMLVGWGCCRSLNILFTSVFRSSYCCECPSMKSPPPAIYEMTINILYHLSLVSQRERNMRSLTHWGRVTHICVSRLTITGSDNGLLPGQRQAIIWTNVGILLIGPLGTNFSENLIEILTFSFTKMRLIVSSAKWRPFCLGLNVLSLSDTYMHQ